MPFEAQVFLSMLGGAVCFLSGFALGRVDRWNNKKFESPHTPALSADDNGGIICYGRVLHVQPANASIDASPDDAGGDSTLHG